MPPAVIPRYYSGGNLITSPSNGAITTTTPYYHARSNRPASYHSPSLLLSPLDLERSASCSSSISDNNDKVKNVTEPIYQEISEAADKLGKNKKDCNIVKSDEDSSRVEDSTEHNDGHNDEVKAKPAVVYGMITAKQAAKFVPCTQTFIVRN